MNKPTTNTITVYYNYKYITSFLILNPLNKAVFLEKKNNSLEMPSSYDLLFEKNEEI